MSKKTVKTTTSRRRSEPAKLVLASGSRYRKELLERLGLPFAVAPPAIDETAVAGEAPAALALRLAEAKARAAAQAHPTALIIGSDQVAEFDGSAVGKPRDRAHALQMLSAMSGRTIVFHTALVLLNAAGGRLQTALVDVASTFRALDQRAIDVYLDRDQPYDCAGAVRVESAGIALFTRVASDDPTALIGLPLIRLTDMLLAEGVKVLQR
ncbi:MAG TPA: Maf family nucleotide pyrophosphatase [Casimicrobiaceae bacterium]|nr:Maf family nucleotide pyrophosphatase [Casimicrobiaceae bacterium]